METQESPRFSIRIDDISLGQLRDIHKALGQLSFTPAHPLFEVRQRLGYLRERFTGVAVTID